MGLHLLLIGIKGTTSFLDNLFVSFNSIKLLFIMYISFISFIFISITFTNVISIESDSVCEVECLLGSSPSLNVLTSLSFFIFSLLFI